MPQKLPFAAREAPQIEGLQSLRAGLFAGGTGWSPIQLSVLGHTLQVDPFLGSLTVTATDFARQYYGLPFGLTRTYDSAGQSEQLNLEYSDPNYVARRHLFGNWSMAHEARVSTSWPRSRPELTVSTPLAPFTGFRQSWDDDFRNGFNRSASVDDGLARYGVPRALLDALGAQPTEEWFLLRTTRGQFGLATGEHRPSSLVDQADADLWLFAVTTGLGYRVDTSCSRTRITRDVFAEAHRTLVTVVSDALGHRVRMLCDGPDPDSDLLLEDDAGRSIRLRLGDPQLSPGLAAGQQLARWTVAEMDTSQAGRDAPTVYRYHEDGSLAQVELPPVSGARPVMYDYDDNLARGLLSRIRTEDGRSVEFEYMADSEDFASRLEPRIKLTQISLPDGIRIHYEYDATGGVSSAEIERNGQSEERITYDYVEDLQDTRSRFGVRTSTVVQRGYAVDQNQGLVPSNQPETVAREVVLSDDGRFNPIMRVDPMGRQEHFTYNEFNQVEVHADFRGHVTTTTFDLVFPPTPVDPHRYDKLAITHTVPIVSWDRGAGAVSEAQEQLTTVYSYERYDADSSAFVEDRGGHSTHRIARVTDQALEDWWYEYDDAGQNRPVEPTEIRSPFGSVRNWTYGLHGEIQQYGEELGTAEERVHDVQYTRGLLSGYTSPNLDQFDIALSDSGDWPDEFVEPNATVEVHRDEYGRPTHLVDQGGRLTAYEYHETGRLAAITQVRDVPASVTQAIAQIGLSPNVGPKAIRFGWTAVGRLREIVFPDDTWLRFDYDEAGRLIGWARSDGSGSRLVVDPAGMTVAESRMGAAPTYHHYAPASGQLVLSSFPEWHDGDAQRGRRTVEFLRYDPLGRALEILDSEAPGAGSVLLGYDRRGSLSFRRDKDGAVVEFEHDADGRPIRVRTMDGACDVTYAAWPSGDARTVNDHDWHDPGVQWDYQNTVAGPPRRVGFPFAVQANHGGIDWARDFDSLGRLASSTFTWPAAGLTFAQTVQFGPDSTLERLVGDQASTFEYDSLLQLVADSRAGVLAEYDDLGNRIASGSQAEIALHGANTVLNGRVTVEASRGLHVTYDALDRVSSMDDGADVTRLYYDGADRLRRVSNSTTDIRYQYDHTGRLAQRSQRDVATGAVRTEGFRYAGRRPIVVTSGDGSVASLTWDQAGNLLRLRRSIAFGGPAAPHSRFAVPGALGDVVAFLDGAGAQVANAEYSAWGDAIAMNDPDDLTMLAGYRGTIRDPVTGWCLFGRRWYAPELGRWLSPEPHVRPDAAAHGDLRNFFAYSHNSPVELIDRSGLSPEDRWAEVSMSMEFERDPSDPRREALIDLLYELQQPDNHPDIYMGNVYPMVLNNSIMAYAYSSAARYTPHRTKYNQVRWFLQHSLIMHELLYADGQDLLTKSPSFVKAQHDQAFMLASGKNASGLWTWKIMQRAELHFFGDKAAGRITAAAIWLFNNPER